MFFPRFFALFSLFLLLILAYEQSGLYVLVGGGLQYTPSRPGEKESQEDMDDVHQRCQRARLKRFKETCEKLRSKYKFTNVDEFPTATIGKLLGTIDDAHKFIMTVFPKTGCSSWNVVIYNNTRGAYLRPSDHLNPHGIEHGFGLRLMKDETKESAVRKLKEYFAMINVRHPMKRLESAYKDKFYRATSYEIALLHKLHKDPKNINSTELMDNRITFAEFLDHILTDGGHMKNTHWRPFSQFNICSQYIDYIARTESALTDMSYIINNHLSKKGNPVKTHSTGSEGLHYETIDLPFFSTLTDPQKYIDKLYMYKDDFDLFGYNYKIDADGKVTGGCDNIINGICC